MEVILRGVNEGLVIGDDVIITVLDVQHDCVRLAIQDPSRVPSYWEQTLFLESAEDQELEFDQPASFLSQDDFADEDFADEDFADPAELGLDIVATTVHGVSR